MKELESEHNDNKFENYCKLWCFGNLKDSFQGTCFGHLKKKACQYAPLNENISKDILNVSNILSQEDL